MEDNTRTDVLYVFGTLSLNHSISMRNILPFYSEIYHLGKGSVPKRSFNVLNYSSSRNYLSDMRYKRDILPISYGLLDLKLLRPVSFEWKNNTLSHGTKLGFIAQEVKTVIPEAVTGSKEDYYGLNNSYLIAVLIQFYKLLKNSNKTISN